MGESKFLKLGGGPENNNGCTKGFNTPDRKNARNHLYTVLRREILRNKSLTPYDVYRVLRLLTRKVKEGTL